MSEWTVRMGCPSGHTFPRWQQLDFLDKTVLRCPVTVPMKFRWNWKHRVQHLLLLRRIPELSREVWKSSPTACIQTLACRLVSALFPVALLAIGGLLLDAINGDAALFSRADEIELAWGLIDPILAQWQSPTAPSLITYEPGSWGPAEADELLAQHGWSWLPGCGEHEVKHG